MSQNPSIAVLHDRVPGRLRLHAPALYRNPSLKAWIQDRLSTSAGIDRIHINTVTGNLVIAFDPAQGTSSILQLLHTCLADPNKPPQAILTRSAGVEPKPAGLKSRFGRRHHTRSNPAIPPHARWHTLTPQEALAMQGVSPQGLSDEAARERLARYGSNELAEAQPRSPLQIVLEQWLSPPVILLGVSAAISVATGGFLDALVILAVMGINTAIGYVTEAAAEAIIQGLESMTPVHAEVVRGGQTRKIPISQVVVGDILKLTPGTYIAADARLLSCSNLTIDESALTGESLPVIKTAEVCCPSLAPLAERHNMVYRSTVATGGNGTAVVVATGRYTEIGLIQSLVGETQALKTPMQLQLDRLGFQLALVSSGICAAVFGIGIARGLGFLPMLKSAISLAVAAVPEGLPTVATTTLALGIRRMRARRALVRRLNAVENLGAVQVICFDKTGTLTLNRMAVTRLETPNRRMRVKDGQLICAGQVLELTAAPEAEKLLEIVTLCSEVMVNEHGLEGSPTEKALIECAQAAGIDIELIRQRYPQFTTVYRAEDRPYMITYHRHGGQLLVAVKGNPQAVLELCSQCQRDGQLESLSEAIRHRILAANEAMAGDALRVLGVAYGYSSNPTEHPSDLIWLGLVGMEDTIRPGIEQLIRRFHRAGIDTVMITGDQSATAISVARSLNLHGDKPLEVIDSTRLDKVEVKFLRNLVRDVTVFARVSPAHKLRIVRALQDTGKVVAMIGDGINDAPALKAADIGIAMGQRGTDVARSVADVVLEDDNLETLYTAIEQGRTIYANTLKSLRFLLATNLSEIQLMLAGVSLGATEMLSPMQLLWINLLTDIFPGLALSQEPPEEDVMSLPPRKPDLPVLDRQMGRRLVRESLTLTCGALGVYGYSHLRYGPGPQTEGLVFQTLTLAQLLHALSCRSAAQPVFTPGRKTNPYLTGALGVSLGIQAAAVILPGLRKLLGLSFPDWIDLLAIGAGATMPLLINETIKAVTITPEESQ